MSFHKLDKARDKNFWSVRVSSDIRLIVHKTAGSLLLCYVDHHDKAYDWAERRKLETHPKTGAAQLVEIRETRRRDRGPEVRRGRRSPPDPSRRCSRSVPTTSCWATACPPNGSPTFAQANEDTLLELADHLPAEAPRRCWNWRRAAQPQVARPQPVPGVDPFEHPDAQRRFRVMSDVEELRARPRVPVGEVDGLSASRAAAMGGARLHRAGAGLRLGRHRQDDRRAAPRRLPGAQATRTAASC